MNALLRWVAAISMFAASGIGSVGAAAAEERVRVVASERYEAGRLYRFTFGGGYRELWKTEIELPVLDLGQTGGGLVPTRRFGGL